MYLYTILKRIKDKIMKKIVLTLIVALGVAGGYAQNETGKFSIKPMAGVNISAFSGGMDGMYHTKAGRALTLMAVIRLQV